MKCSTRILTMLALLFMGLVGCTYDQYPPELKAHIDSGSNTPMFPSPDTIHELTHMDGHVDDYGISIDDEAKGILGPANPNPSIAVSAKLVYRIELVAISSPVRVSGTGWQIGPYLVATAAHTVTALPRATTALPYSIASLNPSIDTAILHTTQLAQSISASPKPLATNLHAWVVCYFPQGQRIGSLSVARPDMTINETLPDGNTRPLQGFTLNDPSDTVSQGCSGAPILDDNGLALGMVVTKDDGFTGLVGAIKYSDIRKEALLP